MSLLPVELQSGEPHNDNTRAKVIIVEDEQVLRESLSEYLSHIGFDVTAVDTGLGFYHALAEQTFHVAIIDLGLPDINGLQLAEYVRNNTTMRCLILTARNSVDDRVSGYDAGADLYMVKPVDSRELGAALSRMIQRSSADTLQTGTAGWRLNLYNATITSSASSSIISLTSREVDFLKCLAGKPGETVNRSDILATLGYSDDEFANRALESLVRRIRRKLESVFDYAPIQTRHGIGYSFAAPITVSR